MKSENLNFLEPSGPLQACNGTDLPLHVSVTEDHHEPSLMNFSQVRTFLGGWIEDVHKVLF